MKHAVRPFLLLVLAGSCAAAGWAAVELYSGRRVAAEIAALQSGRDVAVSMDAPPALLLARARYALAHGQLPAAQAIADRLGVLHVPMQQAELLYAIGNYNLRRALGAFTQMPFRVIAPRIRLAKAEYRQSIQLDPGNWDARYNYALASALVRDTEASSPTAGDEMAHERAAWPDIPGAPNGMP